MSQHWLGLGTSYMYMYKYMQDFTYMSNPDSSYKIYPPLGLQCLQCLENLVQVISQSHTNLRTVCTC